MRTWQTALGRGLVPAIVASSVVLATLGTGCAGLTFVRTPVESAREVASTDGSGTGAVEAPAPSSPAPTPPAPILDEVASVLSEAASHVAVETFDPLVADEPPVGSPLDELATVDPVAPATDESTVASVAAAGPAFDIPIEMNDAVLAWIERYTQLHRHSTESALARSGRYLPMFRRIFDEAGIPQDLVFMAHVESAYRTTAYSRARAKGIFQFMTGTARHYGLRVDYWVDDRSDPEKSARAAATYMKKLYGDFGDWYLAIAAYNAGEGTVRRAIARSGTDDFWKLARTRYLRRETKNHVPAVLAATVLSKRPSEYGLSYEPEPQVFYDTVTVDGAADLRVLARCAGTDAHELARLNPALRRGQTPPDSSYDLRVPEGRAATTIAALESVPRAERVLYVRHKVRSGESLSVIASRYSVGVRDLQAANGLGRRTMIRAGQTLNVPTAGARRFADLAATPPVAAAEASGPPIRYRVRRGDTLSALARRYGTSASAIARSSKIALNSRLQVGQRLTIAPGGRGTASSTSVVASNNPLIHVVRRGDTLWGIASAYRTTVKALCSLNRVSPDQILRPGARLKVALR